MTTYKKTIVLNNSNSKSYNGSAILTLTKNNTGIFGKFSAFNIKDNNNLVLGLAQNNKQIFKQNISLVNNNTYNFKLNNLNLNENLSCVLIEDHPTKVVPLIWGSSSKEQLKNEIIENFNILKNQPLKTESLTTEQTPTQLEELFNSAEPEIENLITDQLSTFNFESSEQNLNNSSYENFNPFDQKNQPLTRTLTSKTIIDEEVEKLELSDDETFYESISEQLEDLFNKYPAETNLENLIPSSKWVKIDYENNGNIYVLGLIYDDITLKYICYGVPGTYSEIAPNGLDSYSQWLPTNPQNPTLDGYWVMYQDAISGESVLIDAI